MRYAKRKRTRSMRRRRPVRGRRSFKKRRTSRKRYSLYRAPRNLNMSFNVANEIVDAFTVDSTTSLQQHVFNFRLEHLQEFYSWSQKFEEVRVNAIVVKFIPVRSTAITQTLGVSGATGPHPDYQVPTVYWRKDYSDPGLFSGDANSIEDQWRKNAHVHKQLMKRPLTIKLRPCLMNMIYCRTNPDSGAPVNITSPTRPKQWMQMNTGDNLEHTKVDLIPWIKMCVTEDSVHASWRWKFECKYYVSFRGRRG